MFDKLIESDTAGAEFKNRSRYFTVSTIIVGILFLTAVVYSLYAAEVGLGSVTFDVSELVAPLETSTEPETPQPRQSQPNNGEPSVNRPNSDMARVDETTIVPTGTSAKTNSRLSLSWEGFDPNLPISSGSGITPGDGPRSRPRGTGSYDPKDSEREEIDAKATEPPPPVKAKSAIVRTSKLLNGSAISLPIPGYPKPAQMLNLEGNVNVQVTIDEQGKVISAKAIDGHMLFRQTAEQAARSARFRPTLLNDALVKVTGVIVYRFKRS